MDSFKCFHFINCFRIMSYKEEKKKNISFNYVVKSFICICVTLLCDANVPLCFCNFIVLYMSKNVIVIFYKNV